MFDALRGNQTLIISLDLDNAIFDRLKQVEKSGVSLVEINTADTVILQELVKTFPKLFIGAGNIINTQQLEDSCKAGVKFITSPGFLRELAATAQIYSMPYIPGVATLSEAMEVATLGLQYVRPLPGSLSFCTLLNKHLPSLSQIPTVELDQREIFLSIPSVTAVTICNPECKISLMV